MVHGALLPTDFGIVDVVVEVNLPWARAKNQLKVGLSRHFLFFVESNKGNR